MKVSDRGFFLLVILATTLLHVVIAATTPVSGDEAYYWDCSRHLDWTYFDQPPLVIWAMIPFRAILGETALAVRAPAIETAVAAGVDFVQPLVARTPDQRAEKKQPKHGHVARKGSDLHSLQLPKRTDRLSAGKCQPPLGVMPITMIGLLATAIA